MQGREFKTTDLNIDSLNDNHAGVVFRAVPINEIKVVSIDEWRERIKTAFPKEVLSDWRLIEITPNAPVSNLLVGSNEAGEWATSPVIAMASDFSAAVTESGSLYLLEDHGEGDPTINQISMLVFALRSWGLKDLVNGWPEVAF